MRFRYDPTLTFGNVMQLLLIGGACIGGYSSVLSRLDRHEAQIASTERILNVVSHTQAELSENLRVLTAIVEERTRERIR